VFGSAAVIVALGGGGVIATASASSVHKRSRRQFVIPSVYVGYADSFRKGSPKTPSPWKGSPGVKFRGCNYFHPGRCPKTKSGADRYDSGAVRVLNDTGENITITKATVVIGSCTFHPWRKLNVALKPEQQLILTQTGGKPPCGHSRGKYNFDSLDASSGCTNDEVTPIVQMANRCRTTTGRRF
jgi:hypothetical protein